MGCRQSTAAGPARPAKALSRDGVPEAGFSTAVLRSPASDPIIVEVSSEGKAADQKKEKRCPKGHALTLHRAMFRTLVGTCDGCSKSIAHGTPVMDCATCIHTSVHYILCNQCDPRGKPGNFYDGSETESDADADADEGADESADAGASAGANAILVTISRRRSASRSAAAAADDDAGIRADAAEVFAVDAGVRARRSSVQREAETVDRDHDTGAAEDSVREAAAAAAAGAAEAREAAAVETAAAEAAVEDAAREAAGAAARRASLQREDAAAAAEAGAAALALQTSWRGYVGRRARWTAEALSSQIEGGASIRIASASLRKPGAFSKSFAVYVVQAQREDKSVTQVEQRYSSFEALDTAVRAVVNERAKAGNTQGQSLLLDGLVPLPAKRLIGNTSSKVIEVRRRWGGVGLGRCTCGCACAHDVCAR